MSIPIPMPLWCEDWLTSETVDAMSASMERGYLRLLMRCWMGDGCSLPEDERILCSWSKLGPKHLRNLLKIGFESHPNLFGRLTNVKLHSFWMERRDFEKKRSDVGRLGAEARWEKHASGNAQAMPEAMPRQCPPLPLPLPLPLPEEKSVAAAPRPPSKPLPSPDWPGRKLAEEWATEQHVAPSRLPQWWAALQALEKEHGWPAVAELVAWVRRDEFWSRNCRSPLKLRRLDKDGIRYWDRLRDEMEKPRCESYRRPLDIPDLCP